MTLKEFYEQIDSDYKDVIKRLCDENMIKKFVFKFPEDPSFNDLKDCMRQAMNLQKNSETESLIIVTNCIMQLKDCIRI